jgi:DNA-binding NarL/FixJ family response regulator
VLFRSREVYQQNAFFSPSISRVLLEARSASADRPRSGELTERETEILTFVAMGMSSIEISNELCISPKTVEKHRQQLMDRLDIHDVAGLTRYALLKGLIQ